VRSGPAFLVEAHFYHWSITCATRGRKARSPPLAIVMQKNSIALWSFSNPSVKGLLHRSDTTSCTLDKASNGAGNPTGRGIAERGHHIGLTQVQQLIGKCWLLSRSCFSLSFSSLTPFAIAHQSSCLHNPLSNHFTFTTSFTQVTRSATTTVPGVIFRRKLWDISLASASVPHLVNQPAQSS
jgi:hypothetical protein